MHSIITRIIHSRSIKDSIAIGRGLYKVIEGAIDTSIVPKGASWHHIESQSNIKQPIQMKGDNPVFQPQKSTSFQQSRDETQTEIKTKVEQVDVKTIIESISIEKDLLRGKKLHYTQADMLKGGNEEQLEQVLRKRQFQQSSIPANRFSRFWQFGRLGFNLLESGVSDYVSRKITGVQDQKAKEKIAAKFSEALCKMRGAPLKIAQMLSIQQDNLIPAAIRRAFEKARQTSHIVPIDQVQYMMKKNLGQNWRLKFKVFDDKPFASASIGQVHKAILLTEQPVAVKVQYPGVSKSVNSDLDNLSLLMKIPGLFPKGIYIERIIQNTRIQLMQECDYQQQRKYQRLYTNCLNKVFGKEAYLYKVPQCIDGYCTKQILTSEYLSGRSMNELQQGSYSQELRDEIGRRIMQLTFNELFQMGIMQSDPNPANFTYNIKKDQLNLMDFGATHIYDQKFLQQYYRIVKAAVQEDLQTIWEASIQTGFVTGEENSAMKNAHIKSIMLVGEALRYKGVYDFGSQAITKRIYQTIPVMLKNRIKNPPKQVYSLHRKLSGSYLACIRLKAKVDCSEVWRKIKFRRVIEQELI